jgi:hypothetical protein
VIDWHSPAALIDVQTFIWLPSPQVVPSVQVVPLPPPLLVLLVPPPLLPLLETPPLELPLDPPPSTPVPPFTSSLLDAPEHALTAATAAAAANHPSKPALIPPRTFLPTRTSLTATSS